MTSIIFTMGAWVHRIIHLFFFRKVFSRTNVVSPAGGASRILLSSSTGEQHILPSQAFVQARLQARRRGREASLGEAPEQEANSGWMVQQFTPTLRSTLVTLDIRSVHLIMKKIQFLIWTKTYYLKPVIKWNLIKLNSINVNLQCCCHYLQNNALIN